MIAVASAASVQAKDREAWNKRDLVLGTAIALIMGTMFTILSSGMSLVVTFVPGIVLTWLAYVWLYVRKAKLPEVAQFLPHFFSLLAVQFVHFAEEFTTGFRIRFPELYGGAAYSADLFVTFNMVAYCLFSLSCILAFTKKLRFLLVPALFFVIYGAIGNAISHTWWSLYLRSYFPGLYTAQIFWIGGPLVLHRLVGWRPAFTIMALFALVLVPLLTFFASPRV